MLEIFKKSFLAMRNFFNRPKSRLDSAEKRIKERDDQSTEMIKTEAKERKKSNEGKTAEQAGAVEQNHLV